MRCFLRPLNITYKDPVTNREVRNKLRDAIGNNDLLSIVTKHKLKWYGHILSASDMTKTILQGTVKGTRGRGRQRKNWEDNIKDLTGLEYDESVRAVEDRVGWRRIVETSCVAPQRPSRLSD